MTSTLAVGALALTVVGALVAVVLEDLLWAIVSLAGGSLGLAMYFFLQEAAFAAVFEATVAAGLVSVLFLFVISLTDTERAERVGGTKALLVGAGAAVLLGVLAVVWQGLAVLPVGTPASGLPPFTETFWTTRSIDVLSVIVLLFVGVLAIVRLTTEFPDGTDRSDANRSSDGVADRSARVLQDGDGR